MYDIMIVTKKRKEVDRMTVFGITLGAGILLIALWNVFYSFKERNKDYNIQLTKLERKQLFSLLDEWKDDDNEETINHIEEELSLFSLKAKLDHEELDFLQEMLEMELISREDNFEYGYEEDYDMRYDMELIESLSDKVDSAISSTELTLRNATM